MAEAFSAEQREAIGQIVDEKLAPENARMFLIDYETRERIERIESIQRSMLAILEDSVRLSEQTQADVDGIRSHLDRRFDTLEAKFSR